MTKKTSLLVSSRIINNKVAVELGNFLFRKMGLRQQRAFTQAHMTIELLDKLNKGTVEFDFYEKDGTYRYAIGSLHPSLLPQQIETPKKHRKPAWPRDYFAYYDLVECGWRCFKASLLNAIYDNDEML